MTEQEQLKAPFTPDELHWRVGNVSNKGDKCTLLAYMDARAVQNRLDNVFGIAGWKNTYKAGVAGGVICVISVYMKLLDGSYQWISKEDGADNTNIEATKGGLSDSFKRCAVQFGIGRYLYDLPLNWHEIKQGWAKGKDVNVSSKGKSLGHCNRPQLPSWALPATPPAKPKKSLEVRTRERLLIVLADAGIKDRDLRLQFASAVFDKPIQSFSGLDVKQMSLLNSRLGNVINAVGQSNASACIYNIVNNGELITEATIEEQRKIKAGE